MINKKMVFSVTCDHCGKESKEVELEESSEPMKREDGYITVSFQGYPSYPEYLDFCNSACVKMYIDNGSKNKNHA